MTAYYNEIDPYAAQWLRNLISAGHIAPGDVDERSIEDVRPGDLRGYTQCHFFAGIGVWSHALRRAGWSDDRPVWTGSCPCQPFSSAGAGTGFDDERHLWPAFFHLISQCCPSVVFGEQVASKDAEPWIDLVQTDLEGVGYRVGAVPFPSAGVGAPHVRDRLYWVAYSERERRERRQGAAHRRIPYGTNAGRSQSNYVPPCADEASSIERDLREWFLGEGRPDTPRAGPTNGHWRDSDWLKCVDGKFRPVEPGTFPLANGATSRVGQLRAYGNAINAEAARVFILSSMDCI